MKMWAELEICTKNIISIYYFFPRLTKTGMEIIASRTITISKRKAGEEKLIASVVVVVVVVVVVISSLM